MLFIGLLFSPIVFSKAEGKKETAAKEAAQASPKETYIPVAPMFLYCRIWPNPAEYYQNVIIEYSVEPSRDPNLRIEYYLNDRPISQTDLFLRLNKPDDYGYRYKVSIRAINKLGEQTRTFDFFRRSKP